MIRQSHCKQGGFWILSGTESIKSSRKKTNILKLNRTCRMVSISSMTGPNLLRNIIIPPFGKDLGDV
jgi:hypothetical protein